MISAGGLPPVSIDKNGNVDVNLEVPQSAISDNDVVNNVQISVITSILVPDIFGHGYPINGMILGLSYPDTDSYGNPYTHTVMALSLDNATYNKINWKSFNPGTLCDLLMQQNKQGMDKFTLCGSI